MCLGGGDYVAVAEEGKIRLYAQGRLVQELDVKASCLAAEGDWLIAYVPERRAIWRYRLVVDQEDRSPSIAARLESAPCLSVMVCRLYYIPCVGNQRTLPGMTCHKI